MLMASKVDDKSLVIDCDDQLPAHTQRAQVIVRTRTQQPHVFLIRQLKATVSGTYGSCIPLEKIT